MSEIKIAGIPFEVVSDEEANTANYVVCMPLGSSTPFDDNETGRCCKCGVAIMFRPYIPKRPPRICVDCMMKLITN